MQLQNLSDISRYKRIYLSPHLDDAALSCGAAIAASPDDALVITMCSAAPPPGTVFNAVATEFHAEWGLEPGEVVSARLAEDALAMEILRVDYYHAEMVDAIYRVPDAYNSRATLYRPPVADDPLLLLVRDLLADLHHRAPDARLFLPLGVGNHVDHLVVFDAAGAFPASYIGFYDDINYALLPGAVDDRLAAIDSSFVAELIDIDEYALATKLDAIAAYASQMDALFGGVAAMRSAVSDYHAALGAVRGGFAERVWRSV